MRERFGDSPEFEQDPFIPQREEPNPEVEHLNAFSKKQRLAIHVRDGHKCNFPDHLEKGGKQCEGRLEVHHILPQGYCRELGINPDYAENALTICQKAHDTVHPDSAHARKVWKPKSDAFLKVQDKRQKEIAERKPYWNTAFDREMNAQAVKNTQIAQSQGWSLPEASLEEEVAQSDLLKLDDLRERLQSFMGSNIISLEEDNIA